MSPATETAVDLQRAREMGLSEEEFGRLGKLLGRAPTLTELGITSALWLVRAVASPHDVGYPAR